LFVPGFGGIGRPRDIHTDMSDRSPLLRQLACGRFNLSTQTPAPTECFLCQNGSISKGCGLRKLRASCRNTTKPALCAILNVQSQLRSTVYFAKNTWAFVCGDLDQGLFWQLFYLQRGTGTWSSSLMRHKVDHFWGNVKRKPWMASGHAKVEYLSRLDRATLSRKTACTNELRNRANSLGLRQVGSPRVSFPGWAFSRFPLLPSTFISDFQSFPTVNRTQKLRSRANFVRSQNRIPDET